MTHLTPQGDEPREAPDARDTTRDKTGRRADRRKAPTGLESRGAARRKTWKVVAVSVAATLAAVAAVGAALWRTDSVRVRVAAALAPEQRWPRRTEFKLRRVTLERREHARARGDLEAAAVINADLAQEALLRARAVQQAWMAKRHPGTKLFGRTAQQPHWEAQHTGADLFGFLYQAAVALDPASLPALRETLDAEARLAPPGELCLDVDYRTGRPLGRDHAARVFGSSEYVKDGLLSVYERHGADPAAAPAVARMFAVLDAVVARSSHPSSFGPVPGTGSEENGNVLQACSRLSFSAGGARADAYAAMAARIADAVVQDVLPANHGLPATHFDYSARRVINGDVHLRDHGNEIIAGLSEAYALAVARRGDDPAWAARADRWAEPLASMYEKILAHGRNADGLLVSRLDPATLEPSSARANDNWGYLLNGALLYAQAARLHGRVAPARLAALEAAADEVIAAVVRQYGLNWQRDQMDGYADTLESAMYVAAHRPTQRKALMAWVDDQIGLMYSRQRDDGLVGDTYLDGNFIRTAMMYADQKRGGWRVDPWRPDVRVGWARDGSSGRAAVVVSSAQPYAGTLRRDPPRHRTVMRLPWDWPRLNSWPEWSPAPGALRAVASEGLAATPTEAGLAVGVPLDLPANGFASISFAPAGGTATGAAAAAAAAADGK